MKEFNLITIVIAAIVFILIWIFGGGFWDAVEVFCATGHGIVLLMIFAGIIVGVIFSLFEIL